MKKLVAFILVVVMTLSLTACGSPAANDPNAPLKVDPLAYTILPLSGTNGSASLWQGGAYVYLPTKIGMVKTMFIVDIPENDKSLSNGDKVHVHAPENLNEEMLLERYGVILTRTEGDVVISGLNEYGQPGASDGKKAKVNLNDYLYINPLGPGRYEFGLDYLILMCEHRDSMSKNLAPEELKDHQLAWYVLKDMFEAQEQPFTLTSATHEYYNSKSNAIIVECGEMADGDKVTLSWEVNTEVLQEMAEVFNVEFVYKDITLTADELPVQQRWSHPENN